MLKRISAFSLIELLIVVAIVAILAAIAVPNFLESQVRTRVVRAKSDMRAVVMSLEAYRMDANHYPPAVCLTDRQKWVMHDTSVNIVEGLLPNQLSTPVAYMAELPLDSFPARAEAGEQAKNPFHYLDRRTTEQRNQAQIIDQYSGAILGEPVNAHSGFWVMSVGPDLDHDRELPGAGNPERKAAYYDTTNGTISSGDIYYFNGVGMR